jgi:hypothetical protein
MTIKQHLTEQILIQINLLLLTFNLLVWTESNFYKSLFEFSPLVCYATDNGFECIGYNIYCQCMALRAGGTDKWAVQ